ncbi:MAG: radical SAM protein [Spirochaetaceae bacterium]|nr:MAG: radical SAM protein [Spirochaetaceae bacterium]
MSNTTSPATDEVSFARMLNSLLRIFFWDALRISIRNPGRALFFLKTVSQQRRAASARSAWRRQGFHVPPIALFSVTNRCNLHCKGCYSWALHKSNGRELSTGEIDGVFAEAKELGILFFVLAGGEPFVRSDLIKIMTRYPEIIFLVFTNGLLIDSEMLAEVKQQKNIIPVVSMEGYQEDTDGRRGEGVYQHLQKIINRLKKNNIFYSISITLTRSNFTTVTDDQFIKRVVDLGCKLLFLVEYSPVQEGTEGWVISEQQRATLMELVKSYRSEYKSLFISIPGDEEEIGGCLSAGRGFVHISASGDVEPCPFAPYSDSNLRDSSLKEALQSKFLSTIRRNRAQLTETEGGCALWVKREWVRSVLHQCE